MNFCFKVTLKDGKTTILIGTSRKEDMEHNDNGFLW